MSALATHSTGTTKAPATVDSHVAAFAPSAHRPIRRILLATAGGGAGREATAGALALANQHGAELLVVSVFVPRVAYPVEVAADAPEAIPASDRHVAEEQLATVRAQLEGAGAAATRYPIRFAVGDVGKRVRDAATADHADLVVMGTGRRVATERRLGDRAAIVIAAALDTPVLGVAPGFTATPRRVLVMVGLDATSLAAAITAASIFREPDTVFLVHVTPPPHTGVLTAESRAAEDDGRRHEQLDAARRAVEPWHGVHVEAHVLNGDPVERILQFVRDNEIDLVVGGLHGGTYDARAHIRNLALHLLADAECSVLIVPSSCAHPAADGETALAH